MKRGAEVASELGLEAGSGTGTRRPGEELRPGELRTAGKEVDAAIKLGQRTGHAPGGQARTGPGGKLPEDLESGVPGGGMYTGTGADVEEVVELLGAGRPGGELRNGRRSLTQRSTIQRSLSQSRSRKAMRELKSEEVTSILGERGLMRSPYRSCMAMLKGWTSGSSDGRPRGKQGNESRKLGGPEEGEPHRSRRRRWEAPGGGAESLGERPKGAGKETGRGGMER